MAWTIPTIQNFKDQFFRDFKYGEDPATVTPRDIQKAINQVAAYSFFNPNLYDNVTILGAGGPLPPTTEGMMAFLFCAAHFLYLDIKAAGGLNAPQFAGGLSAGPTGPISSKSVGGVSVNYEWPDSVSKDPMLFQFAETRYGAIYLQMFIAKIVGRVGLVMGEQLPTGFVT